MIKVGITGQAGFVGTHLYNTLALTPERFERIAFERWYFDAETALDSFVASCDVIVHLSGMNRHEDPQVIYKTNIELTQKLITALERTGVSPHVIFSSSSQEERDNEYGRSKKQARIMLEEWAKRSGGIFTGMLIPNVFGPFGKPFYNSAVATFCHQLTHDEEPIIQNDVELRLIYINELVGRIVDVIIQRNGNAELKIEHTTTTSVSEILAVLKRFKNVYSTQYIFPALANKFEYNLFNTYRCYEDIAHKFPVKFKQHSDVRGIFTEIVKLEQTGQVSFSTTHPGVTRGNHFHTRKIERFAVISGKARIQLRKFGSDHIMDFFLSGAEPAFVDMPVWHIHNITNIGTTELITIFWINEFYDPADPDTYFEEVSPSLTEA